MSVYAIGSSHFIQKVSLCKKSLMQQISCLHKQLDQQTSIEFTEIVDLIKTYSRYHEEADLLNILPYLDNQLHNQLIAPQEYAEKLLEYCELELFLEHRFEVINILKRYLHQLTERTLSNCIEKIALFTTTVNAFFRNVHFSNRGYSLTHCDIITRNQLPELCQQARADVIFSLFIARMIGCDVPQEINDYTYAYQKLANVEPLPSPLTQPVLEHSFFSIQTEIYKRERLYALNLLHEKLPYQKIPDTITALSDPHALELSKIRAQALAVFERTYPPLEEVPNLNELSDLNIIHGLYPLYFLCPYYQEAFKKIALHNDFPLIHRFVATVIVSFSSDFAHDAACSARKTSLIMYKIMNGLSGALIPEKLEGRMYAYFKSRNIEPLILENPTFSGEQLLNNLKHVQFAFAEWTVAVKSLESAYPSKDPSIYAEKLKQSLLDSYWTCDFFRLSDEKANSLKSLYHQLYIALYAHNPLLNNLSIKTSCLRADGLRLIVEILSLSPKEGVSSLFNDLIDQFLSLELQRFEAKALIAFEECVSKTFTEMISRIEVA